MDDFKPPQITCCDSARATGGAYHAPTCPTSGKHWRVLREEDDITVEMEEQVRDCVDWFDGEGTMPTTDFIDRFAKDYGGDGYGPNDWDIDNYDSPAARKIMRIARSERRSRQ